MSELEGVSVRADALRDRSANAALSVQHLSMRRGRRRILQDISFVVPAGSVLAVLGPNGAGKSTLLKALAGLLPYEGSVHVSGCGPDQKTEGFTHEVRDLQSIQRARCLGYVPQRTLLRSALRVEEVVGQGRYARNSESSPAADRTMVARAMELSGATHLGGRSFLKLSIGEQQRVLMARSLATEAQILLLDEPTAALDVGQALAFFGLLKTLCQKGYTFAIAMHDLADARRHADAALLLSAGRLVQFGVPSSVVGSKQMEEVYGVRLVEGIHPGFELLESGP
ncbi:MAG: ABC transporter ATP-binding protein [Myxococcota bacterium]